MISGNVIESTGFTLQNLLIGGGNTTAVTRANYAVCSATYTTPLIKGHVYVVYFKYSYTVKQGSSKKPTWVGFWPDGGDLISSNSFNLNGATSIECYGVFQLTWQALDELYKFGTIYQGPSEQTKPATGATEGDVTGSVTNFCLFDVTELYQLTKGKYDSLDAFGKGIKDKLTFVGTNKFSVEIADNSSLRIGGDYIYGNIVEAEGLMNKDFSPNSTYGEQKYYMDENWLSIYNYKGASNKVVTHTKVEDTSNPFYPEHPYVTKIVTTNAEESTCAPNLGGFVHSWYADKTQYVIVQKLIANVPTGYDIQWNGYLGTPIYQSDTSGTGTYKEYTCIWKDWSDAGITNAGKTSMSGYVSIKPKTTGVKNVIWYVAFYGNFQFTKSNYQTYQGFSVTPNKDCIKGNTLLASKIDSQNLLPNGDGSDCKMTLPSKYQWATDINDEIEGYCCLRQPSTTDTRQDVTINGQPYIIGEPIPINPMSKYRLTYRVKAEVVPDSYLSAIVYYRKNSDGTYQVLNSNNTTYINGTRTTLAVDSDTSKNTLQLTSVDNWKTGVNYAGVGFKTNPREEFKSGDVQRTKASSKTCLVTAVDTTAKTITLVDNVQKVYKAGTYVYQSQDQSSYYYPAQRSQLKAGEWVSIKAEFGNPNQAWDGTVAAGGGAWGIPFFATHMGFAPNIYANSSGKPIYYDNIRIEEIYSCGEKRCDKVQIKRYDGERKGVVLDGSVQYTITSSVSGTTQLRIRNKTQNKQGINSITAYPGDTIIVSVVSHGELTIDENSKYYLTITNVYSDDVKVTNYQFIMPYRNVTLKTNYNYSRYIKVKKGTYTAGCLMDVVSPVDSFSFSEADATSYFWMQEMEELQYTFSDGPSKITGNNPYLYVEAVNSSGTIVWSTRGPLENVSTGTINTKKQSVTINMELYSKKLTHTVTVSNAASLTGCDFFVKSQRISSANNKVTVTTGDIVYCQYNTSTVTEGNAYYQYRLNSVSDSLGHTFVTNYFSFEMPDQDVTLTITNTKTRVYALTSETNNCSVKFYVNNQQVFYAVAGEQVSVDINASYNNIKVTLYNSTNNDEFGAFNQASYTFTMPSYPILAKATSWESSSGGTGIEGYEDENITIFNIANTLATRVPYSGNTLNNEMYYYTGRFDELTDYYVNHDVASQLDEWLQQQNPDEDGVPKRFSDWGDAAPYTLWNCSAGVYIDFLLSMNVTKIEFLCCNSKDDPFNAEHDSIMLELDHQQGYTIGDLSINGLLQLELTNADTYVGHFSYNNSGQYCHCLAIVINGEYDHAYFINFDYTYDSSVNTLSVSPVLCAGYQQRVMLGLNRPCNIPVFTAENDRVLADSPTCLDGEIYFLNTGNFTYSIYNIILNWFEPEETYVTFSVVNRDYVQGGINNDCWFVALSAGDLVNDEGIILNQPLSELHQRSGDLITYVQDGDNTIVCINSDNLGNFVNSDIMSANNASDYTMYISIIYRGLMWVFLTHSFGNELVTAESPDYDGTNLVMNYWVDVNQECSCSTTGQTYHGRILSIAY